MNKDKKLVTRQETITKYKSSAKPDSPSPSQVFGLIPETVFSKPHFIPKVTQLIKPYNLYATCDEKSFYIFDKQGKIKNSVTFFEAFHIQSCTTFTYIEKHHCFAIVSSDLKLLIVSVLLDLWKSVPLSGRVNHIDFHNGQLFLAGTSKLTVMSLHCESVYEIEKSLLLDPDRGFVVFKVDVIKEITLNIKWIKGLKVFKQYDMLLIWSECTVIVISLPSSAIKIEADDLCPGTLITEVGCIGNQDYLIAATTQGSIYVYKIGNSFKLIHVFQGHTRTVTSITLMGNLNFITASMDYTLKVWNLEQFRLLYTFDMPVSDSSISCLALLNQNTLAYYTNTHLNLAHLNFIGKLMFITVSSVKYLKIIDEKIAAIGEDNSIVLYESGKVVTTIYPPPSAHDLKDIMYIEDQRRVLVLLDSGVICLFSIEAETGLLERMIRTGDITDSESRALSSPIQCIKQVKCTPPQYDCELVFRKQLASDNPDSKYLAVSAGKGTLIFVDIEKIDKIYSRFSIHRENIIAIEELPGYMITMCSAFTIFISSFKDYLLTRFKKIELKSQVSILKSLSPDKLFLSFNTGHSEIVQVTDEGLYILSNKDAESDLVITSVDIIEDSSSFAVAFTNNVVSILTFDKQLLHEIKFPHPISSVLLINESVVVSYKQITTAVKVSSVFPLGITDYEEINEDYFKYTYTYQQSEPEVALNSIDKDRMTERTALSPRPVEHRNRPRNEIIPRRKKPVPKKPKKKRFESKNDKTTLFETKDPELELYKKIISKKIPIISNARSISNNVLLTRRQLTEEKIIENVRRYGDPADRIDYTGLCVVDESLYYEELAKLRGSTSII